MLTFDDDVVPYEDDVMKNPFNLKSWLRYLAFKSDASPNVRYALYERALKLLPGSYKLWAAYLRERRAHVRGRALTHKKWEQANSAHERALIYMNSVRRLRVGRSAFLRVGR